MQVPFGVRRVSGAAQRSKPRQPPPLLAVACRRIAERHERTSMKPRKAERRSHHWRRADYNFAVVSVALLTLFLLIGVGAWIFGAPSMAGASASPPASQTNTARS